MVSRNELSIREQLMLANSESGVIATKDSIIVYRRMTSNDAPVLKFRVYYNREMTIGEEFTFTQNERTSYRITRLNSIPERKLFIHKSRGYWLVRWDDVNANNVCNQFGLECVSSTDRSITLSGSYDRTEACKRMLNHAHKHII